MCLRLKFIFAGQHYSWEKSANCINIDSVGCFVLLKLSMCPGTPAQMYSICSLVGITQANPLGKVGDCTSILSDVSTSWIPLRRISLVDNRHILQIELWYYTMWPKVLYVNTWPSHPCVGLPKYSIKPSQKSQL